MEKFSSIPKTKLLHTKTQKADASLKKASASLLISS